METKQYFLWENEEYYYARALGFIPNIMTYIHEESENLPAIIIVPGGGYCFCSPSEGEIVAKKFYNLGYNTFVLTYTINPLMDAPLFDQPMKDLSRAIRFIRKNAKDFKTNPNAIAICGFSAGGHLVGSVAVHHQDITDTNDKYKDISNKPNVCILSYPVISVYQYSHGDSFIALLGNNPSIELKDYYSLEKNVNENTPPCFVWQTRTDELVPVENSYLFANALKEKNINYAHHVFSSGKHGQSVADDDFTNNIFGYPYTIDQTMRTTKAVLNDEIEVSKEVKEMVREASKPRVYINEKNDEVAIWVNLADTFIKKNI